MRNRLVKWSLICLALFILVNFTQVHSVNGEEDTLTVEVGEITITKRSESNSQVFPESGSFKTFFKYDESNYIEQGIANFAISEVAFNLTGILNINVLHFNGTPVSNLSITLENTPRTIQVNATTDYDGKYAFNQLDQNENYSISLVYEGVPYYKEFSFTNESLAQLNIVVYETTRSDVDIIINSHQVFVLTGDGFLSVHEYLFYQNLGLTVFNNSRLSIGLPQEIRDFTSSIMDCCVLVNVEGAMFDPMDPIMPGQQYGMWLSYYLDVDSPEYMFRRTVDYSTQGFHLFVENNGDFQITSPSKLQNQGTVTIDDKEHTFFLGSDLEDGTNVTVNISGFASSSNLMTQLVGIILISMTTTFLVSYPIMRRKRDGKTSVEDFEKKKLAVFRKIAKLDSDYASGDISRNKYNDLKSKYKKNALRLMQQIDETKIHQSQSNQSLSDQRIEAQVLTSTLKKLEEDMKKGLVSKEGYEKIKVLYETHRIKVMETLRKLEEKANDGE